MKKFWSDLDVNAKIGIAVIAASAVAALITTVGGG